MRSSVFRRTTLRFLLATDSLDCCLQLLNRQPWCACVDHAVAIGAGDSRLFEEGGFSSSSCLKIVQRLLATHDPCLCHWGPAARRGAPPSDGHSSPYMADATPTHTRCRPCRGQAGAIRGLPVSDLSRWQFSTHGSRLRLNPMGTGAPMAAPACCSCRPTVLTSIPSRTLSPSSRRCSVERQFDALGAIVNRP